MFLIFCSDLFYFRGACWFLRRSTAEHLVIKILNHLMLNKDCCVGVTTVFLCTQCTYTFLCALTLSQILSIQQQCLLQSQISFRYTRGEDWPSQSYCQATTCMCLTQSLSSVQRGHGSLLNLINSESRFGVLLIESGVLGSISNKNWKFGFMESVFCISKWLFSCEVKWTLMETWWCFAFWCLQSSSNHFKLNFTLSFSDFFLPF